MTGLVLGLVDSVDTRKTILGVMGAFLGSLMYAAPLTVMVRHSQLFTHFYRSGSIVPRRHAFFVVTSMFDGAADGDPDEKRGVHAFSAVSLRLLEQYHLDNLRRCS